MDATRRLVTVEPRWFRWCLWAAAIIATVGWGVTLAKAQCDPIDFNRDGLFPDTQDVDDFLSVFAGGTCLTGTCGDIDFNNDGLFPDVADRDAFLRVFAGGPCGASRVVYLSSAGLESNDGLTRATPVRRWPTAWSKVRDGYGDDVCILSDLLLDEVNGAAVNKRGLPGDPITIFGDNCPSVTRKGLGSAFHLQSGGGISHVAFVGINIVAAQGSEGWADKGVSMYARGTGLLIEDCSITGFRENISLSGIAGHGFTDIRIRRCVIADASSKGSGHSQGVYTEYISGVLLEENTLDRNGKDSPSTFNHGYYCSSSCTNVTTRGNIVARSSATGLQQRCGVQHMLGNLLIENPMGGTLGHDDYPFPARFVTGSMIGNVIVGTADIRADLPRRYGFGFGKANGMTISGNVAMDGPDAGMEAFITDRPSLNVDFAGNRAMRWGRSLFAAYSSAVPLDPSVRIDQSQPPGTWRTLEAYMGSLGETPTRARFTELARARDPRCTAQAAIGWMRASGTGN